ncbi:patatin-like phospholipase family protein [Paenibacillus sp. 481]|uniref:patatin-like phospholipase family protein n=1 Tax=Paenibacillus sp. 481 TaxID=2835869 RepID=UPI001E39A5CC|nr:patatin-like phospholipase family protein [Paenibacillus sp. 481]UHA73788.1 patatin-like phospholipase family protein [Paenibacillus sp. 481]
MKADAVFEGGGVRGIAFVGAIEVFEQAGYEWDRIAGTSAGAIVAALLASGYRADELKRIMFELDYAGLLGRSWLNRIPLAGPLLSVLFRLGIFKNDVLERWIAKLLHAKGVDTFADLPDNKLKIIASDVSSGKMIVLPDDLKQYGHTPQSCTIASAVRMSTTIPYFYQPYKWKPAKKKKPHYVLDGGLLSNFPIWIFDVPGKPRWPTFGLRLSEQKSLAKPYKIGGPITLFTAIFSTMLRAHDKRHVDQHTEKRTVFIPTEEVSSIQFDLAEEDKMYLYESGKTSAQSFLTTWSFDNYVRSFRM